MLSLLSFFTRLPVKSYSLRNAAKSVWMLPLLSMVTSAPAAIVFHFSPRSIAPALALLTLYSVTGLIHLDGLADFSDGVMAKGDARRKVSAMKDVRVGIAGIFSVLMVLTLQIEALRMLRVYHIFVAELNSKTSMLLAISTRRPLGEGIGKMFMDNFKSRYLLFGLAIYASLLGIASMFSIYLILSIVPLLTTIILVKVSISNFGGINGDCIGAIGEIVRVATFLFFALVTPFI